LITVTVLYSPALTLASVVVEILFKGALPRTRISAFTDAVFIKKLMVWALCFDWTFTLTSIKILDLWLSTELEPTITVTGRLV